MCVSTCIYSAGGLFHFLGIKCLKLAPIISNRTPDYFRRDNVYNKMTLGNLWKQYSTVTISRIIRIRLLSGVHSLSLVWSSETSHHTLQDSGLSLYSIAVDVIHTELRTFRIKPCLRVSYWFNTSTGLTRTRERTIRRMRRRTRLEGRGKQGMENEARRMRRTTRRRMWLKGWGERGMENEARRTKVLRQVAAHKMLWSEILFSVFFQKKSFATVFHFPSKARRSASAA